MEGTSDLNPVMVVEFRVETNEAEVVAECVAGGVVLVKLEADVWRR